MKKRRALWFRASLPNSDVAVHRGRATIGDIFAVVVPCVTDATWKGKKVMYLTSFFWQSGSDRVTDSLTVGASSSSSSSSTTPTTPATPKPTSSHQLTHHFETKATRAARQQGKSDVTCQNFRTFSSSYYCPRSQVVWLWDVLENLG